MEGTITISILISDVSYTVDPNNSFIDVTITDSDDNDTISRPRISIADSVVEEILRDLGVIENSPKVTNAPTEIFPRISVRAMSEIVNEGSPVQFEISSNQIFNSNLIVKYNLTPEGDFFGSLKQEPRQIVLSESPNSTRIEIHTIDDTLAEQDGALTLTLIETNSYTITSQFQSKVLISDFVDRQQRAEELTLASQDILPEITGAIGSRTHGIATNRIQQAFSDSANSSTFTFNGNQDLTTILTSSGKALNENSMTLQDYLGNSSFAIDLYPEYEGSSLATIWGIGDFLALTSENRSSSRTWAGDVFTGHLGIDTKIGQGILTGISTSLIESDIKHSGVSEDGLIFNTRSTAINPYLGWSSTDGITQLRSIAGFGVGEINIDQSNYQLQTVTSTYHTLGVSGDTRIFSSNSIFNNGISELTITGQSWLAKQNLIGINGLIDSMQTDVSHYQIGLVSSHTQNLIGGSTLVPKISVHVRGDSKDQQSIFGMEYSNELIYTSPLGFSISGISNWFLSEQGETKKWDVLGNFNYDQSNDQLGPLIEISSSYGQAQNANVLQLWSSDTLASVNEYDQYLDGYHFKSEVGFGISILDHTSMVTPFGSIKFSEISSSHYNIGTRLQIGRILKLELSGIQEMGFKEITKQKVQLNGTINW